MAARIEIKQIWFARAIPQLTVGYIGTGPEWRDVTVTLDRDNREAVIKTKKFGTLRIPLENVLAYQCGGLAAREDE